MRRTRPLAWLMLAVWASWICAAQALCVARSPLGFWTPDLALILLVACIGSLHRRDVLAASLIVAMARLAYTVEPAPAVLAAFLAFSVAVQLLRRLAEFSHPLLRVGLCAGGAGAFVLWFALVHALRMERMLEGAPHPGLSASLSAALLPACATALTSGLAGLVLLDGLVRLPGLTPLRRRRW